MGRHHNTRRHIYSPEVESFVSPARDFLAIERLNHLSRKEFSWLRPKSCLFMDMFCERADPITYKLRSVLKLSSHASHNCNFIY